MEKEIIRGIYDTIENPDGWADVLSDISQHCKSSHAFITARDGPDKEPIGFFDHGFEPDYFLKYSQHFYQVDVWTQNLANFQPNRFHPSHKVCADNKFLSSEIYNDFAKPSGIRHSIGCFLGNPYSQLSTEIAFMRNIDQGHFDDSAVTQANQFLPHIANSIELANKLSSLQNKNNNLYSAFDQLDEAVIICNKRSTIEHCNTAAVSIMSQSGLFKPHINDRLLFTKVQQQQHFDELKNNCLQSMQAISAASPQCQLLYSPVTDCHYLLKIKPWMRSNNNIWGQYSEPGVIIFLRPVSTNRVPSPSTIASLLMLTTTEAEVTYSLCQGCNSAEIAHQRKCSIGTVRQHIKSCLKKCDCISQTELVSKVLIRIMF